MVLGDLKEGQDAANFVLLVDFGLFDAGADDGAGGFAEDLLDVVDGEDLVEARFVDDEALDEGVVVGIGFRQTSMCGA